MKLGREPPVLPQIRDPFGIAHIRFAPCYGFDVLSMSHHEFKGPVLQGEDGVPKDSG
jgi:hypothetical protein